MNVDFKITMTATVEADKSVPPTTGSIEVYSDRLGNLIDTHPYVRVKDNVTFRSNGPRTAGGTRAFEILVHTDFPLADEESIDEVGVQLANMVKQHPGVHADSLAVEATIAARRSIAIN